MMIIPGMLAEEIGRQIEISGDPQPGTALVGQILAAVSLAGKLFGHPRLQRASCREIAERSSQSF